MAKSRVFRNVILRRLRKQLADENKIIVARSLSVEKHNIRLATLISALFYDLAPDRQLRNDLRRPTMEEIGYRTDIFTLDGIAGSQREY